MNPTPDSSAHHSADHSEDGATALADQMIDDSVARLFAAEVSKAQRLRAEAGELDSTLWRQATDAGLPLLLATEAAGGLALGWTSAYPVLRGLGHWQVPLPLAETMVAALLGSLAGFELPDGPLTVLEQGRCPGLQLGGSTAAPRLNGTAHGVPWARHARAAVVSLADGRLALLPLSGPDVRVTAHANVAGLPHDTLQLSNAPLAALAANPLALAEPVWALGALARSAMLVGALESALAQATRYAGERVQFGKPIGKNQAIQQNLALMAGDVAAARVAALVAAAQAPNANQPGTPASWFSTAVAKVRAGEAATRGAGIAHQVHGAIGFTHEHALHFATRRLWAWREEFGSDASWAGALGRAAIQARAAGFWPAMTRQQF